MARDWTLFRLKVEAESCCRVCNNVGSLDAAHIVPRSQVSTALGEDPRNCVPLCREHHSAYDSGALDLLPYLRPEEQSYAVLLSGSIITALSRLSGTKWTPA